MNANSSLPPGDLIKTRPKRSVYRETHAQWGPVIAKRFHGSDPWQPWRDRQRAQREAKALRRWAGLGLPVPAPVHVRRQAGYWEVLMPEVLGARTLEQFLEEAFESPAHTPRKTLREARAVGRLLARMDDPAHKGIAQGDLHAGNVLLDPEGQPWLIDPTPAPWFSSRRKPNAERWVRLCAGVREISSALWRAALAAGYQSAQGPVPLPSDAQGREDIEIEARNWRWREARSRDVRWLRESGAVVPSSLGWITRRPKTDSHTVESRTFPTESEVVAAWLRLGRMQEMHLPALRPRELVLQETARLDLALPIGATPLQSLDDAKAAGTLFGKLQDRGMLIQGLTQDCLWQDADRAWLVDPTQIEWADANPVPWTQPHAYPIWSHWRSNPEVWRSFVQAFCDQQSAGPRIRKAIAQGLLRE